MKFVQPNWPAPAHIKAYTTTRSGWGGRQPHHHDTRGYHDATHPGCVTESADLKTLLQMPEEPIWLTQTHSTIALEATPANREQTADASYTNSSNRVCVVMTADCLPLLICNKSGTSVAAIHAGWRGLAGGIIENTVEKLALPGSELLVWLGPAIGPKRFEVGPDVYTAFTSQDEAAQSAFIPHTPHKWLANLYTLAKQRLARFGITDIYGGDYCTHTQSDLFFSYRRDQGKTGRMASAIWIDSAQTRSR